jgi:hypothetical protein
MFWFYAILSAFVLMFLYGIIRDGIEKKKKANEKLARKTPDLAQKE